MTSHYALADIFFYTGEHGYRHPAWRGHCNKVPSISRLFLRWRVAEVYCQTGGGTNMPPGSATGAMSVCNTLQAYNWRLRRLFDY